MPPCQPYCSSHQQNLLLETVANSILGCCHLIVLDTGHAAMGLDKLSHSLPSLENRCSRFNLCLRAFQVSRHSWCSAPQARSAQPSAPPMAVITSASQPILARLLHQALHHQVCDVQNSLFPTCWHAFTDAVAALPLTASFNYKLLYVSDANVCPDRALLSAGMHQLPPLQLSGPR